MLLGCTGGPPTKSDLAHDVDVVEAESALCGSWGGADGFGLNIGNGSEVEPTLWNQPESWDQVPTVVGRFHMPWSN